MDGATNELAAAGYGRSAELKAGAYELGKWAAVWLDRAARGVPDRFAAWPEYLWTQFCESSASVAFDEAEILAMHESFCEGAVRQFEVDDIDCRDI
jgi:hypothetical protein